MPALHRRFRPAAMLRNSRPEPYLYRLLREYPLRRLGGPHVGIAGVQGSQLRRGQVAQRCDRALYMLKPLRGVETMQDHQRRQLNDSRGQGRRIL